MPAKKKKKPIGLVKSFKKLSNLQLGVLIGALLVIGYGVNLLTHAYSIPLPAGLFGTQVDSIAINKTIASGAGYVSPARTLANVGRHTACFKAGPAGKVLIDASKPTSTGYAKIYPTSNVTLSVATGGQPVSSDLIIRKLDNYCVAFDTTVANTAATYSVYPSKGSLSLRGITVSYFPPADSTAAPAAPAAGTPTTKPPTSKPASNLGRIQGITRGGDHIVSLEKVGSGTKSSINANSDGSFYFYDLAPSSYIVRVDASPGYTTTWTACGGKVGSCHNNPDRRGPGTEATVGLNGGYIDLWWDYTPTIDQTTASAHGYIVGFDSSRCLDVYGAATTDWSVMDIYDCVDQSNQKWRIEGSQIIGVGSGKCLDIPNNNNVNGQRLQIYTCNGTAAQQWTLASDGSIRNAQGKCVDVNGFKTSNSSEVQIWDCSGAGNQRWIR